MKTFTLGFVFNTTMKRVALIEKRRPDWQAGKHNGIGGKIEPGEKSIACMVRELAEESGMASKEPDWTYIALLHGADWNMDVYALIHNGAESELRTTTDETVGWFDVSNLPVTVLSNVPWLIHLAKDKVQYKKFNTCHVEYI